MTAPGLTFVSWCRTGLASSVPAPANANGNLLDVPMPSAVKIPVRLDVSGVGSVQYDVALATPGHAVGIDPTEVIRTDPAPGAIGVQPNYLVIAEFDSPDLPWLLSTTAPARTPYSAHGEGRRGLRPWITLIVVPDRALDPPSGSRPLPQITVDDAELPDLETNWLWAHAQVLTSGEAGETVDDLLATAPDRTLSRLICPRRLEPNTAYIACVVPAFDASRRAGLGFNPITPAPATLTPAWQAGAGQQVQLPVYHSWRFSTGQGGDFEALARKLKPFVAGSAGVRSLDVGEAGSGLPGPAAGSEPWVLQYEGAIIGADVEPGEWPDPWKTELQEAITVRLDSSADELAPPVYGRLQAGFTGAPTTAGGAPAWLLTINLDPRYRVVAGLGTTVVQHYQEALMTSAWEQTSALRAANRLMRQARLSRSIGESIANGRLNGATPLGNARLLQLTAAAQAAVAAPSLTASTVAQSISANSSLAAVVQLPFRRLTRSRGPLARRLTTRPLGAPVEPLALAPGQVGAIRATPRLRPTSGLVDFSRLSSVNVLGTLTPERVSTRIFPWETVAPAPPVPQPLAAAPAARPPQTLPVALLSDLLVSTLQPPVRDYGPTRWTSAIARGLDFDGHPQVGWEQLTDPRATAIGFGSRWSPYAATYADTAAVRGVLGISAFASGFRFGTNVTWSYGWTPGYPLDQQLRTTSSVGFSGGFIPAGEEWQPSPAVATCDVTGSGRLDAVFMTNPGGARLGVALQPDGRFAGGIPSISGLGGPHFGTRLAAAGPWLFILDGGQLSVVHLSTQTVGGETLAFAGSRATIDLDGVLPEDYRGGAIAAADFGGSTGIDLLLMYTAGAGSYLRAGYRIAFDVGPMGTVGGWGPDLPAPIPVAGPGVGILLGAMSAKTDSARATVTEAFRSSAARTQTRQQRILPSAAPPAQQPEVPASQLADDVRAALDPAAATHAAVAARLRMPVGVPQTVNDPLQPFAMTPQFPYPTYELMRDEFQGRLFPGGSGITDNTVTALLVDDAVVESFLAGLNHEMSRELAWRGFPVHHGTYFSSFWDGQRPDITTIEDWGNTALGTHSPPGAGQTSMLLVVRGELLRRIPDVTVYAAPSKAAGAGRTADTTNRIEPRFTGRLNPDIAFFGFALSEQQARGTGAHDGYYFVFQEHPAAPRFGLDEPDRNTYAGAPGTWRDLDWNHLVTSAAEAKTLRHIDGPALARLAGVTIPDNASAGALSHQWGFSAAHMAHATLQVPVQVAIHASRLLPEDPA